jgi:dTDP-4-amino-4,6-dideoxygalactose transaminase
MTIPLVDLAAVQRELGDELEAAVLDVVRSFQFVGGERIAQFEGAFADYLGVGDVVAMANGTDALEMALRALEVGPGDEVLVPANTFIATAEAVVAVGASARFVDVDARSGLIDLDSAAEQLTERTSAMIPVHMYGRMVDMDACRAFAARHGLAVIEDAAQAHGARRDGCMAGTVAEIGCFSFYPGKNLGAFGDAGAAVTNDPRLAERMRLLRDHGRRGRHNHEIVGFNSRMDPVHAAVLTVKLSHLDRWNERRRQAAEWYRTLLPEPVLDWRADVPEADVHHLFPIIVSAREALAALLGEADVQTGIHYPRTVPSTRAFGSVVGPFPAAEGRAEAQLSLPMHPHLEREHVEQIAGIVAAHVTAPELA